MMRPEEKEDTLSTPIASPESICSGVGDHGPDSTVDAVKGSVNPIRLSQLCEGRVTRYAPPSSSFSSSSSTCSGGELAGQTQGQGEGEGQGERQGQGHPEEEGLYETVWSDGATLYFGELAYQNARVLYDKIAAEKIVLEKKEEQEDNGGGESGEGKGQVVEEEHGEVQGQSEDVVANSSRKRKLDNVAVVKAVEVDHVFACKVEGGAHSDKMNLGLEERNDVFNEAVNEVEEGGVEKKARMNPGRESVVKDQVEVEVEVGGDAVVDMIDGDIDEDDHLRIVADSVTMGDDDENNDDDDDDDGDDIEGGEGGEEEEGEGEEGDVDIQDSEDVPLPLHASYPLLHPHPHSHPLPHPHPHPLTHLTHPHPLPHPTHPTAGGQVLTPLLMRSKYSVPYETVLKWR